MEGQGIRRFLLYPGFAAIGVLLLGAMPAFSQTYVEFSSKPNIDRGFKTKMAAGKIESQTAPSYLAAAVTVFSDDFNNSTLDLNKWRLGTNAGNQAAVINNALQLRTQNSAYQSGCVVTRNAYPARNTTIAVKVIQPNNDGDAGMSPTYNLSSIYGIYNEANFYRFYTYRNTSSGPYRLYVEWKKNGALSGIDVTGNLVINGAVFLRLRGDDTKIHFDASLDGATWTDTYNETFALPGYTLDTPFYYELAGYKTWANGALVVDDFSITSQSTDTQPPQISAVAVQNITGSSAQITWQTDEAADSQVEYGLTASYGNTTPLDANLVTSHSVQLFGLAGNTTYHYRVKSKDTAGNPAASGDFVFQTSAPGNNITVLQDALNNGTLGSRSGGQFVSGGWQVTGVNDMIVYDLGRYIESGACEVHVRNFSPGAQNTHARHHFLSMFRNPWGNHHPVENQETVWDLHAGSNYDPGVKMLSWTYIANEIETRVLDSWNLSQTYQIKVAWNGNQLQYFRDGVLYATHTNTAKMQLRYLFVGRDFTVSADLITNFQNNQYPAIVGPIYSNLVVTEAVSATDQTPPLVGNITASDLYVNGARLAWTTDEPAACYVEYGPTNSYGQKSAVLGPPAQTFATTLANLVSNQTYHYRIVALDNAGKIRTTADQIFTTAESGTYVFKPVADAYVEQAGLYGTTRDYGNYGWMNLLGGAGRESYLRFNITGVNGNITQSILRLHGRQSGNSGGILRVLNASWDESAVTWRTKPNVTGQQLGAINSVQAGQWHEISVSTAVNGNGTYNFALVGTGANLVSFDSRESTNLQPELIMTTAALDITPPVISSVAATAVTTSSATINWTTNEASDSQVEYGLTTSYGLSSPLNTALVTSHTVTLSSLQANTTYHYRVKSKDAANNLATSGDFLFTTLPPPPTLTLTSPNGGESWTVGAAQNITWNSTGTLPNVKLEFSVNNGANWTTITASTANDGNENWTIPNNVSNQCLVRVSDATDGNPADVSDAVFAIIAPAAPTITTFTPNSGPVGTMVTITGSNFIGVTSVVFNGMNATSFAMDSGTQIRATVPTGATTGKIGVTNPAGTGASTNDFVVATILTFNPSDDAYVRSDQTSSNFGTATTLRMKQSSPITNSYLKFVVSGVTGTVQSAKLRIKVTVASSSGGSVYSISNNYLGTSTPWIQSGLNYNNAPSISGTALSMVGSVTVDQVVEFDVTSAITGNGTFSFGLKNSSSTTVRYSSKEGATQPELVIQTVPAFPSLSINDVTITEGNIGTVNTVFTVSLSEVTSQVVTVAYATANGPATAGSDYGAASGILTFPAGTTTQPITVPVIGDAVTESNETFLVNLSNSTNATLADAQGQGTITDDDMITITLNPTDDAYVRSDQATSNFGTATTLRMKQSSPITNSYLKFVVTGVSGAILSAKLRLKVTVASSSGGSVYLVSNNNAGTPTPWTQSGLNYNNAPSISGTALSTVGSVTVDQVVEFEVTSAITGNGTFSFGLKNSSSTTVRYSSKEGATQPELVIQFGMGTVAKSAGLEPEASAPKNNEIAAALPERFTLLPNYPNPFNAGTKIVYQLPERSHVKLVLRDLMGREMKILANEEREAGTHEVGWDGRDASGNPLPSGIYIYSLQAGSFRSAKKLLLVK